MMDNDENRYFARCDVDTSYSDDNISLFLTVLVDRDYHSYFASAYSFWSNTKINKEYTVIYHLIGDKDSNKDSNKDSTEEFDSNSDDLQMVDSGETNSSDSFSDSDRTEEVKLSEESEASPILSSEELSEISKAFCEAIDINLSPEVSSEEEYEISPQVLELLSGVSDDEDGL